MVSGSEDEMKKKDEDVPVSGPPVTHDGGIDTDRMKVPGGYLYRVTSRGCTTAVAMTFVPDQAKAQPKAVA